MRTLFQVFSASIIALSLAAGCGETETSQVLDEGFVFRVDYSFPEPLSPVQTLSGIQGSPTSVVSGDPDLRDLYANYNFGVVRIAQDDFCDYSMEGIFPAPSKQVTFPSSYEFTKIDQLMRGIRDVGDSILWQASYDIGLDQGCRVEGGRHKGLPIRNATKFAEIVGYALKHFNYDQSWDPNAQDFKVGLVEFVNDPFGLGGYNLEDIDTYIQDYQLFSDHVRDAFTSSGQRIQVLGPSHRIVSLDETLESENKGFLLRFIDWVANTEPTLDILTIQMRFDNPYEIAIAADNVRSYLDKVGLTDLPIWITEIGPSLATETFLRKQDPKNYSAFVGAHLTSAKVALQGRVERVFPPRGTRRYDGPDKSSAEILESAFFGFDESQEAKIPETRAGILPFTALLKMQNKPILPGSALTSDGVGLLAVRHEQERIMWILVGNPGPNIGGPDYPLSIEISPIPDTVSQLNVKYAEVTANSTSFNFSKQYKLDVQEQKARFDLNIPTPSTAYIELTW